MKHIACCALMIAVAGVAQNAGAQDSMGSRAQATEGRSFTEVVPLNKAKVRPLNSKATVVVANPGNACPVSLRALQGTGYGMLKVRSSEPDVPGQRIPDRRQWNEGQSTKRAGSGQRTVAEEPSEKCREY